MVSQAYSSPPSPRLSVVIPTLNEARNLPYVLARLPADVHEVIVVDGYSADDTIAVARQLRPDVRRDSLRPESSPQLPVNMIDKIDN